MRLLTCATVIIRIPPPGTIIYYDVTLESRGFYRSITTFFCRLAFWGVLRYATYTYSNDRIKTLATPTSTYTFSYGDFLFEEMKKILPSLPNANISTVRDITNRFIWSGFKYYLRQPTDSYVLFSPIKYWKSLGLANYKFIDGYLFNRKHFHASPSAISCILWAKTPSDTEHITVTAADIDANENLHLMHKVKLSKVHKTFEPFFDRSTSPTDIKTQVYCEANGVQTTGRSCSGTSYAGEDIIAYQRTDSFGVDPKHVSLTRCTLYNIRGYYLRRSNYLRLLPLFVAKQFSQDVWYDREVYFTTSDGGNAYTKDNDFLKSCLIFTCLSNQNKCLSFDGTDGRRYQNELCFDSSNAAEHLPLALKDLNEHIKNKWTALDIEEKKILEVWQMILAEARNTAAYNPVFNYGVYQITKELNTSHIVGTGKSKKTVYDYPELNGYLETLRTMLKAYYKSHIAEKMFKYELLK